MIALGLLLSLLGSQPVQWVHAEEGIASTADESDFGGDEEEEHPAPKKLQKKSVGGAPRDQGTRALDRFEFTPPAAQRSQYLLQGQPLEVDPD